MILEKYSHIETPDYILVCLEETASSNRQPRPSSWRFDHFVRSRSHTDFLADCLRYREEVGLKSHAIPFQAYFPTFESLDKYRKDFYFYWRHQASQGLFLETQLSYLFLFCYELLNFGYRSDAAFNVSMLVQLYEHYIYRYPKLEKYLPAWIADFLLEMGEPELAAEWLSLDGQHNDDYELFKASEHALSSISMSVWWRFLPLRSRTPYFEQKKQKIYKAFKEIVTFLHAHYLQEDEQNGLFERLFPVREVTVNREFYTSAVIARPVRLKAVRHKKRTPDKEFMLHLSQLMRLAENVVRIKEGVPERLLIDDTHLSEELHDRILAHLLIEQGRFVSVTDVPTAHGKAIPPPPNVQEKPPSLDFDRIQKLAHDSLELQHLFEEKYGSDDELKERESEEDVVARTPPVADVASLFEPQTLEEESAAAFAQSLSLVEKEFLVQLVGSAFPTTADVRSWLKPKGLMYGTFLLTLNDKAEQYLGDVLLEEDEDRLEITEELKPVLTRLEDW